VEGRWNWVLVLGGEEEDANVVDGCGANCRWGSSGADSEESGSISIKVEVSAVDDVVPAMMGGMDD